MGEEAQDRNYAPRWQKVSSYTYEEDSQTQLKSAGKLRRRRCIQCCGCVSALIIILVVVIVILIFTVFRVKDVTISINSVKFDKLQVSPGLSSFNPNPSVNVTMTADVSIKNPNIASFKFNNATTTIYYADSEIGEALSPPGNARARKTLHMNLGVALFITANSSSVNEVQQLRSDISSGYFTIDTYTFVDGRVNVLNIFKRHSDVKVNCTMRVTLSNNNISVQDISCNQHVQL